MGQAPSCPLSALNMAELLNYYICVYVSIYVNVLHVTETHQPPGITYGAHHQGKAWHSRH